MNKKEKQEFINNMFENLKTEAMNKVEYMPDEWGAWELRQYMADKAQDIVWPSMKNPARKKKYNNDIRTIGNLY